LLSAGVDCASESAGLKVAVCYSMTSGDSEPNSIHKKIEGAGDGTVKPIEPAGAAVVELSIILEWFQNAVDQRAQTNLSINRDIKGASPWLVGNLSFRFLPSRNSWREDWRESILRNAEQKRSNPAAPEKSSRFPRSLPG
jgi:hypothetical protein